MCTASSHMCRLSTLLLCAQTGLLSGETKVFCIFRLKELVASEEIYVNHMYWKKKTIKKC